MTTLPIAPSPVPYAEVPSPAEFLATAPPPMDGNSPWAQRYAAEIRRTWYAEAAQAPRTLQQHLGPSELGVACDRQVAGKMAALPETNHVVDPWPSIRGRALHGHAEDVFGLDNLRVGFQRWLTERKVTPHPEHPGTADLYDVQEQAVVDHKFLGTSSMAKIRKEPPRKYRRQLLLYGLGYWLEGFLVRRVVIAAYPATSGSLSGLYIWEQPFADGIDDADNRAGSQGAIRLEVLREIAETFDDTARRKQQAQAIVDGHARFEDIPAMPDNDECYFCPFFRPEIAKGAGGPGCPGTYGAVA